VGASNANEGVFMGHPKRFVLFCFCGGDIHVVGNNKGMVDHN